MKNLTEREKRLRKELSHFIGTDNDELKFLNKLVKKIDSSIDLTKDFDCNCGRVFPVLKAIVKDRIKELEGK